MSTMQPQPNTILDLINFNYDQTILISFFKDLFTILQIDNKIDLLTFNNYYSLSSIISSKVFHQFNASQSDFLTEEDFIGGMVRLYSKSYTIRLHLIFSVIDYNKKGVVDIKDMKFFMLHCHLLKNISNVTLLLEEVDRLFMEKTELTYEEFLELAKSNMNSVILLLLFFFHYHLPIKQESIYYYSLNILSRKKRNFQGSFNSNENDAVLEEFFRKPNKFLYNYLLENYDYNLSDNDNDNEDRDDDLNDLITFESDLSNITSNILENNMSIISEFHKKKLGYDNGYLSKRTCTTSFNQKCLEKTDQSIIESPLFYKAETNTSLLKSCPSGFNFSKSSKKRSNKQKEHEYLLSDLCNNKTPKDKSSFTSPCFFIDYDEKNYETNCIIICNTLLIYAKSKESKIILFKRIIMLNKLYIKRQKENEEDNHRVNLISTINGIQIKYSLQFNTKELCEQFSNVIKSKTHYRKFEEDYEIIETLGSGFSGIVKLVRKKTTKEYYCVKMIPIDYSKRSVMECAYNELDISILLSKVSSLDSSTLKIHDFYETVYGIFIIMEYLKGFTLDTFIQFKQDHFQNNKKQLTSQLINNLKTFNYYGIIHRDLKPQNIIVINLNGSYQAKVIDFGFSKIICPSEFISEGLGTLSFASPELLLKQNYSMKVDVWSLGVILFYFINNTLPFTKEGNGKRTVISNIICEDVTAAPVNIPNKIDKDIDFIMSKCLEKDSSIRPTINDINDIWEKTLH